MNTDVAAWLWSDGPGAAAAWLAEVEAFFAEVEAELSRFRAASGLSRLNAAAGQGPQPVSALLATVLERGLHAAEQSSGVFDPTMLHALQAAGYDRSFERLCLECGAQAGLARSASASAQAELTGSACAPHSRANWQEVELNRRANTVSLPAGLGIDLGGIAKGWTVDRAAEMLGAWGAALVDAGGDIRASAAPGGEPWPVAIQDPFHPERDLGVMRLSAGALVTSTIGRRQWQLGGQAMHHLIDPRTGAPSTSDLHTVTVLGPTAEEAEVAAKVALVLGHAEGERYLAGRGLAGLLVDRDAHVSTVGKLQMEQVGG